MATTHDIKMTVRLLANRAAYHLHQSKFPTDAQMSALRHLASYLDYLDAARLTARMLLSK